MNVHQVNVCGSGSVADVSAGHVYRPLVPKQFRLLRLQPASRATPSRAVDIALATYDVGAPPWYLALSYCWGNAERTAEIHVDGCSFFVTQNLHDALLQFRKIQDREGTRYWWVDAICINQADLDERRQQVLMMQDIFKNASTVIVWLGMPIAGSWNRLDVIETYDRLMSSPTELEAPRKAMHKHWFSQLNHLLRLLDRSYFQRLWMVPEHMAATRAVLWSGDVSQSRDRLVEICRKAFVFSMWVPYWPLVAKSIRRALSLLEPKQRQPLLFLLCHFRGLQCSDPRDKIFALMSVCVETAKEISASVNYHLPTSTLYAHMAYEMIRWTRSLAVLSCVQNSTRGVNGSENGSASTDEGQLPSWAPDWRLTWKAAILDPQFTNHKAGRSFGASKEYPACAVLSPCQRKLNVKGLKIGSVHDRLTLDSSHPVGLEFETRQCLAAVLHTMSNGRKTGRDIYVRTRESYLHALFRTLAADSVMLGSGHYDFGPMQRYRMPDVPEITKYSFTSRQMKRWIDLNKLSSSYLPWVGGSGHLPTIFDGPALLDEFFDLAGQAMRHIRNLSIGRAVFMTKQGYLGLGPNSMRTGDSVYVLLGGDVPFLLRSQEGNEHVLVGECYLHGFMDGAGMKSVEQCEDVVLV